MRRSTLGAVLAIALLAGCGGGGAKQTTDPLDSQRAVAVTLNGDYSAENVGLLMASKLGYFEEVDLVVDLRNPIGPSRPIWYVTEGSVDFAVSHQPQVVLAQDKGVPVVAFGSLVSQPTAAMIWLKESRIDGIADLKGKTIGIYGLRFEKELLRSVLAEAGLTPTEVRVKSFGEPGNKRLSALVSGRVDAIFGGSWNVEGTELQAQGLQPVIVRVQDLGIPPYDELVVIARPDRLRKDPQLIRDFMSAVARGTTAAIEDPKAAAEAIAEASEDPNAKAGQASVEATLPLLSRDGYMDPDQATELVDWMHEEGMVKRPLSASTLLTNEFLGP